MEQFTQAPVALDTQESIDKISEGMTYVVNGNQSIEAATIPVGSYVRLVNSTITGRSDGIYTVKTAIPVAPATIDNTYLQETAPIPGGIANALSSKINTLFTSYTRLDVNSDLTQYKMIVAFVVQDNESGIQGLMTYPSILFTLVPSGRLNVWPIAINSGNPSGYAYAIYSNGIITAIAGEINVYGLN